MISSFVLIAFFLMATLAPPASADVIGPACVTDGDNLMINGKRSYGKCRDGTAIRLFGVVAPGLSQSCPAPRGRTWKCGRASATMLLEAVKGRQLVCTGRSKDRDGNLLAVCQLNGMDINRKLVRDGWVLSYPRHTVRYLADEKEAARNRRGLWQGTTNIEEFEWRNQ